MYRKNTAGQHLGFGLINATTGAALTGATVTAYRVIDGGSQASATGTVSEKGSGQYNFALSQADTNGDSISLTFTATNAIPVEKTIVTTACDPTATSFGLSLAKTTNITGFNDIAATAIVSSGAITTSGGAVSSVTTVGAVSGAVGSVTGNVGGNVTGSVGSVVGNVGGNVVGTVASVVGNVGGNVVGSVASVSAGVTVTTNNDKTGYSLATTPPTAAAIADAVWDEARSGHATAGTFGEGVIAYSVTDKTGYKLASDGFDSITVEAGVNARQALSPILASAAGVLSGVGTSTIVIKGGNVATTRITATVDGTGNRTGITLSLPT